jgi:hypothetical protein
VRACVWREGERKRVGGRERGERDGETERESRGKFMYTASLKLKSFLASEQGAL